MDYATEVSSKLTKYYGRPVNVAFAPGLDSAVALIDNKQVQVVALAKPVSAGNEIAFWRRFTDAIDAALTWSTSGKEQK